VISERLEFRDKITLLADLKEKLGEQQIDLTLATGEKAMSDPFIQSIRFSAIELKSKNK